MNRQIEHKRQIGRLWVLSVAAATLFAVAVKGQTHASPEGSFNPNGTSGKPFQLIEAAACAAGGGTVRMEAGTYVAAMTLDTPATLTSQGGPSDIRGTGIAETTLKVVTYNTHLFGNAVPDTEPPFPPDPFQLNWLDTERADYIGQALGQDADEPDIVGLQEVWDSSFYGNLAAGTQAYGHFAFGAMIDLNPLLWDPDFPGAPPISIPGSYRMHSGLAMISRYEMTGGRQVPYVHEAEFFEQLATKSYLYVTIVKDNIPIGVFNTHLQAHDSAENKLARQQQLIELGNGIAAYQSAHPTHPVIIMGDFNVSGETDSGIGESDEYANTMAPILNTAGVLDAARNLPCFAPGPAFWSSRADNPLNNYFSYCDWAAWSFCDWGCRQAAGPCSATCDLASGVCAAGCIAAFDVCDFGCDGVCGPCDTCDGCYAECDAHACEGCPVWCDPCMESCDAGCDLVCGSCSQSTCDNCRDVCRDARQDCFTDCGFDCGVCMEGCRDTCAEDFCGHEEEIDRRLDYVLYAPSLDGSVIVVPERMEVREYRAPVLMSLDGVTTDHLSDHYALYAELRIVRVE